METEEVCLRFTSRETLSFKPVMLKAQPPFCFRQDGGTVSSSGVVDIKELEAICIQSLSAMQQGAVYVNQASTTQRRSSFCKLLVASASLGLYFFKKSMIFCCIVQHQHTLARANHCEMLLV